MYDMHMINKYIYTIRSMKLKIGKSDMVQCYKMLQISIIILITVLHIHNYIW